MAQIFETDEQQERVLLIGVSLEDEQETANSLEELKELAKTAGAETLGKVIQPRVFSSGYLYR